MPLTNAGRDFIAAAIANEGPPTFFEEASAHIGIGNGNTAFAAAQTDLQGASKFRQPMEAGYPTVVGNVLTFRSLVGTGDGNFAVEEWAVFNAAAAGVMLNRKVESLGTKTSAQTWQLTATITVNIGA